jgi:hypothetical protein
MTAAPELPDWAIQLLLAVQKHQDEHADDQPCLAQALDAVPADITRCAAAIDAHTRPLVARIAELEEKLKREKINHAASIEKAKASESRAPKPVQDVQAEKVGDLAEMVKKERRRAAGLSETLNRVKNLTQEWEHLSGRRDARRELLTALKAPSEPVT